MVYVYYVSVEIKKKKKKDCLALLSKCQNLKKNSVYLILTF